MDLLPLIRLQILDDQNGWMLARHHQPRLRFDRPERIGFGDRACRFDRRRDNAVDERIGEDAGLGDVGQKRVARPARSGKIEDDGLQRVAVAPDEFGGQHHEAGRTLGEPRRQ